MDVKGAKALSERLAEAARNVDPPPVESGGLGRHLRQSVRGRRHYGEGVAAHTAEPSLPGHGGMCVRTGVRYRT